ncbi:MAG: response regulator [Opitutales bacterium]|jgi:CheY-like chemotaxis protein|nr:response regulator [Opitutales bacterium]
MSASTSILLVDDHSAMRATLSDILRDEGYNVQAATSGEEAVGLFQNGQFDAVLMDVRMTGMSGVEAFRKMKNLCAGVKVILMSAFSVDELKEDSLREGVVAFLPKPLNLDNLIDLIAETVSVR